MDQSDLRRPRRRRILAARLVDEPLSRYVLGFEGHFASLAVSIALVAAAVVIAPAAPSFAHPTERELRDAFDERQRCEADVASADRIDPAHLGMSEADLRRAVEELRQDPLPGESDLRTEQGPIRWVRDAAGGVARIEYESWHDRVYRIRWQLSAAFERPVLDELARRGRTCFGVPEFDQTFEAEPGSPRATLRRIGWIHGDRRIELRQLHPLRGGRVFLSVTTSATIREIGAAGLAGFPEPDRSESWWRRPTAPPRPATAEERKQLGDAFVRLLSQLDH